ncbi:HAD family hydrolase [Miniphocaeibacter halophilus]|uniref:HAD family hydrolase n=1 Tax=Miniphocaeibacter halophilus TaxID=2931922 RepID=A0AC61MTJ0_9FIRM|nr:HAD family hydrolase [Miniphocaeibacter halophilus]QQK08932.1 HAD family hydrolase [Miniphocaeibacter halophilus]
MDNIKIIFFDIDGTLIDMNKKKITDRMLETLKQLKKQNIIICIATGRSPIALPHFEKVEFDAFLTFNGSYCFSEEDTIYKNPIPTSDVYRIIENSNELNRPVAVATSNKIIANGKDKDLVEYFSFANQEVIVADEFDKIINHDEVFQLMLSSRKEDYSQIMKNTRYSKIAAWWDRAIDIIPSSSGKGKGIEKILKYYGLNKSEALAFGDGNNDIEMLKAVGWGVAMDNASNELKSIADEVIGHVADEGIYNFCLERRLI